MRSLELPIILKARKPSTAVYTLPPMMMAVHAELARGRDHGMGWHYTCCVVVAMPNGRLVVLCCKHRDDHTDRAGHSGRMTVLVLVNDVRKVHS
jgi:hypothetical protein